MKNISKTIMAFGLSILTVGAMAQVTSIATPGHSESPQLHVALGGTALHSSHHAPRVGATMDNFQLWYPSSDATINSTYSLSLGWFTDQINGRFTEADTNLQSVPRQNFNLVHSASVAYDTLMDGSDNGYNASSIEVDTLWAVCIYKNTSGNNDTVVFSIDSVSPTGLPVLAHPYAVIDVPIYKGVSFTTNGGTITLPGTSSDSIYEVVAIPAFNLPRNHTHFSVNVTFLGSKADTFGLGYGFPLSTCPGGTCGTYDYANPHTAVGNTFTATTTINVNSYAWMFQEYYSNIPTMQPSNNGTILSFYMPNDYEWNTCPGSCTNDTMFFYEQDWGIAASVTTNVVAGAGINTLANNGLSISQNYPNPFNKETTIAYSLTKSSDVTFTVYDITGRVITTNNYGNVAPGQHNINLSANTFSPGIYFYTFNVNGSTVTNKMVVTQ